MALHGAIVSAQRARTVPDVSILSPAGQDLLKDSDLSTADRPNIVESLCAAIERRSLASTDLLRGLALNCREPTIAIVSVARMLIESSARRAHLADPSVTAIDRVCRMLNETVEELNQWDNHEKKLDLAGMSEHDRDMVTAGNATSASRTRVGPSPTTSS
jgi:hypothetical protein